jgi:hypothetical protein
MPGKTSNSMIVTTQDVKMTNEPSKRVRLHPSAGAERMRRHRQHRKRLKRKRKAERKAEMAAARAAKRRIVVHDFGDPCPRCGVPMQIREHNGIGEKQLRQPFFYTRWFCCMNRRCKTTLVMPERYKVSQPRRHMGRRSRPERAPILNNDLPDARRSGRRH